MWRALRRSAPSTRSAVSAAIAPGYVRMARSSGLARITVSPVRSDLPVPPSSDPEDAHPPEAIDDHHVKWSLAIIAGVVLLVAAVSRRLTGTSLTPAMVFVAAGVIFGPLVVDQLVASPASHSVRTLAEATLAPVLFTDASRINLRALRREYAVRRDCWGSACR
jgi:hypothetical protein